jgi:cysteine desulfurase
LEVEGVKLIFDVENGVPYVDNAVTTPLRESVLEAMLPFLLERFADPDEPYEPGQSAAEALAEFREQIAEMVGASPENLWFTSGGTEANNWVIRCHKRPGLPVCTEVEHLSVLANCSTHLEVDDNGVLAMETLQQSLDIGDISIMSIQHANQETGVIQDIPKIAELCKSYGIPLHVDCAMSFGVIPVDLIDLGANFITLSGHKAWGPVGVGALVSDGKYELRPLLIGGAQEGGMRAGPVNMAAIAGFAAAAEALRTAKIDWQRTRKLRDFIERELELVSKRTVVGGGADRVPNISCMTFHGSDGAFMAAELERLYGMCVGIGGAAEEGTSSRVLTAMGVSRQDREASLRFRFSPWLTQQDADQVLIGVSSALRAEAGRPII